MTKRIQIHNQDIKKNTKYKLISAAFELFAHQGYDQTSISQITKKANVSKGLVYNYFESKEELLITIINHGIEELLPFFDKNKDGILEKHEMVYFLEETFKHIKEHVEFWKLYFQLLLQPDIILKVKKSFEQIMQPFFEIIIQYFESKNSEDAISEAILFGSLLDGITLGYINSPDNYPLDNVKNILIKKICE